MLGKKIMYMCMHDKSEHREIRITDTDRIRNQYKIHRCSN